MKIYSVGFFMCLLLGGCQLNSQEEASQTDSVKEELKYTGDNSRVSLDWNGVYAGLSDCSDCDSIQTSVSLNTDESFLVTNKRFPNGQKIADSGKIVWFEDGSGVHLKGKIVDMKLVVGEGRLLEINDQGNFIDSTEKGTHIYFKID